MEIDYNQVKQMAALHYTPEDIARVLAIDESAMLDFMQDSSSDFYKSYWAGYYETDIQLRNSIKKLALAGSTPAQAMLRQYQQTNETRHFYES